MLAFSKGGGVDSHWLQWRHHIQSSIWKRRTLRGPTNTSGRSSTYANDKGDEKLSEGTLSESKVNEAHSEQNNRHNTRERI